MAFKALHEGFEKSSFKVKDAYENVLEKDKNSVNQDENPADEPRALKDPLHKSKTLRR